MKMLGVLAWAVLLLAVSMESFGQKRNTAQTYPQELDLPILDLPFAIESAKSGQLWNSFSMEQSLAVTQDLHRINYHLNNRLWDKWIEPDSKRSRTLNRVAANLSSGLIDYVFTYYGIVFSAQWLHEEYHRNALTLNGIPSYNETYNRFTSGHANGSISRVRDEDLVRIKRESPQELVRSFAAGIESEYLLLRGLQKDNFYRRSEHPNILLNLLLTKHTVNYVNQFRKKDYNASIDSMNAHGLTVNSRDYVGWDFTPWVYDLFRPDEPYEARGVHPSGVGVDRAIKTTSLSGEEYSYLKKMGRMQYLNFLSPFMLGIHRIHLNGETSFNFALRHYLTSFGYDLTADFFLNLKGKDYLVALHGYRNKERFLPGIEMELPAIHVWKLSDTQYWILYPAAVLWLQPGSFYSRSGHPGGLVRLRAAYPLNSRWRLNATFEGKTKGWVAGNPYLKANASFRVGFSAQLNSNGRRADDFRKSTF